MRGDAPLPAASQTQVPLRVVWRDDAHAALRLEAEEASPLPLPPGHTVWPLTVALSAEPLVEIEVGAQLAGWVGEWLLARVLQWEETAPQPAAETIAKPASDEVRERILAAFREALAAPEMGEDDDFFDFGGHSLIATRIIGRLKSLHQIELNINDLFSYPSAAALASKVNMAEPPPVPEPCASVATAGAQAPLSLAQQSLWKIYQALGFSEAFNIPFALRFLEPIDEEIFRQAFADILLRHPALRTLFVTIAGEIYQQVVPPEMLSRYDWFSFSTRSAALPLREALGDEAGHRFRLDDELPVRITFLRDEANGQQVVSLLFHHIVLDEWSVNILMDELAHAVNRRSAGRAPEWRQTPEPFHLFALRQRAAGLNDSHLHFWLERLRGAPAATPVLAPRQADTETSDPAGGWTEFRLEAAVSEGLYRLARRRGASLFNVVYSGIAAALHGLGGMEELTIGTSASGRNDARFFDTIGYFTTVVAHRVDFRRTATLNALIDDVKQQINASMPFTDIPIDLVEEGLFGPAVAHDRHMFEVFIQIHAKNKLNGAFILGDGREVRFRQIDPQKSESVLGLQFEVMEENIAGESFIRVMMSYRADRYTPEQVRQIVGTTHRAFAAMADVDDGADVPLAALCAAAVNTQ
ncbi:chromosome condensation protein [Escherichia alba]|uniref:Chromosome condensation protein n=1 Tax=Intestinirhabdus alba TaxID=2899544 RepID=A0A6L6IMP3_9ENTR|nr:chromosome condensation protein [Intestinirhabdus alba]